MKERQYIPVKGVHPNSRFENEINLELLRQTMERVQAMRLERLYGVPFNVKITFLPPDEEEIPI